MPPDEQERALVLAKRQGFIACATRWGILTINRAAADAKIVFPLPKKQVTQARVVPLSNGFEYKVEGGKLFRRATAVSPFEYAGLSRVDVDRLQSVFAKPTEVVEVDE